MSENNTLAQAEQTTQTGAGPQVVAQTESNVAILDERAYHELVQGLKETAEPTPAPEAPEAEVEDVPTEETPAETPTETKVESEDVSATELPERVRIGNWSESERKALQIRARNPDLTLEQAMGMVKGEGELVRTQEQFVSPDDIEAKIDEMAQAKANAFKNLEFDKVAEFEVEMLKLNKELRKSERMATERQSAEQVNRTKGIEDAKSRSVEFYPDAAKADSALVKKMNEIFDTLVDTGNPLVKDPSMPFKLTQMAANELGIAPRNPNAKAPSPSIARKAPSIQPASGNARTTPQAPLNAKALADKLDDLESYQLLMAKL
jgi:hypothetical protein